MITTLLRLLVLLAIIGLGAPASAMSVSEGQDYQKNHPGTTITTCHNVSKLCGGCGTQNPTTSGDTKSDGSWCITLTGPGSLIDELSLNHLHTATDYAPATLQAGCATCGGGTGTPGLDEAGLMPLALTRTHRFRDMTQHSSFGPGVYGSYDTSLRIGRQSNGSWRVVVTDPGLLTALILTDAGGGLFKGAGWNHIQGLRFYTGAAGTGTQTADPSMALSAVLTSFGGVRQVFDVIAPSGGLPAPWKQGDIGTPASYGSVSSANGTISLTASGTDIFGTADSQGYVYQAIQGDLTVVAQVTSLATYRGLAKDGSNGWAKAGVMIRDGLDANARMINCCITPGNGAAVQSRSTAGGSAVSNGQLTGLTAPKWLRLQRQGDAMTGAVSSDGATWQTIATTTVPMNQIVYVGLSLTSHSNGVLSTATYANVSVTGTAVAAAQWPVPATAPYSSPDLAGRLVQIVDRNGYATRLTYKTWTATQLQQSPDLVWQLDTVTDAHGRTLIFSYLGQQVSGRWAVSAVRLPNGSSVAYSYANGLLSGVAYPDGTASTFTYTADAATNTTIVAYDDAGATGIHRRKQAYLSNLYAGDVSNTGPYLIYNQASNLIRILVNGANEIGYLSVPITNLTTWHYEGDGKLKEITKISAGIQVRYFTAFTFDPVNGFTGTVAEASPTLLQYPSDNMYRQGTLSKSTSDTGVVTTYTADADGFTTTATFSDGTAEKYAYNAFKQVTRFEDRLHRVTRTTYDAQGNETMKEVGILFNGTSDVNQPEYAKFQKQYYPAGDSQQFLLKAAIDANGNTTTYTYTPVAANGSNHVLATVTTPDDAGTGTIVATSYAHDSIGRITSSTDAVGRATNFTYDSRDRLVKTTYSDSSTEIVVYGTGTDKNLITKQKDRQGTLTELFYDGAGRVVSTTVGAKTMSADGATITVIATAQVQAQSLTVQTTSTYVLGTGLEASRTVNGDLTTFAYDYRQRRIGQTAYPTNASAGLTTTWLYAGNLLRQVTDPYGRKTYSVYRASDARLIRQVQGLVPADGLTDYTAAATIARSATTVNPPYLVTDYTLDAEGQQTAVIDPRGITSTTAYDSRGRVTQRVEASSDGTVAGTTQTLYDAQSNVLEVRSPRYFVSSDANGYQKDRLTSAYTHRNLLLSRTAAPTVAGVAGTQQFAYYADGRIKTRTDENNGIWTKVWMTCCARIGSQADPSVADVSPNPNYQGVHVFDYNAFGDQTQEYVVKLPTGTALPGCCDGSAPTGTVTTETTTAYDVRHRPIARTVWLQALGAIDNNNPPIAGQNGVPASQGLTTTYRYDDNLMDALGLSNPSDADSVAPYLSGLGFGVNAVGKAMVEINPAGERRWTIMDGLGRTVRIVDGNGNATTTAYDVVENGLVKTTVTDALGHAVAQLVDAGGRVRVQRDALANDTSLGSDADGNLVSRRDPNGVGEDCAFDARNRRTGCTDTSGAHTSTGYDANGNAVSQTDALGHATTMTYDARDRKRTTLDRVAGTTIFGYDLVGNLTGITDADPLAGTTTYVYDARNLLVSETYPPGQATPTSPNTPPLDRRTYAYDAAHRLTTRLDQAGITTTYGYDLASRLTSRAYSDGTGNDTFVYDLASRLVTATSGRYNTTVSRTYTGTTEHAGRLVSETQTVGGVARLVSYQYDAANRLTGVTYPDGTAVARTFTARNQLLSVNAGGSAVASAITYDAGMRRTALTFGNGLVEQRTYVTGDNLVATIQAPGVSNFAYTYDANKRVTQELNQIATEDQHFGYDNENRVTSWNRHATLDAQTWSLSKVGDWTSTVRTGTTPLNQARDHTAVHEILDIKPSGQAQLNLAYDTKGNLTNDPSVSPTHTYTWDNENRLKTAAVGTTTGTYIYDALGRRLAKTVGTLTTVFVHDGAQVVVEYENGAVARKYVYGSYVDEPLALISGSTKSYVHANRVYSVAALTDASGTVNERYRYDAFGTRSVLSGDGVTNRPTSTFGNQRGFTGYYLDQETGLYNARARMYSPSLGRFTGRDSWTSGSQIMSDGITYFFRPVPGDGYQDGDSLYAAYFIPNLVDFTGLGMNPPSVIQAWNEAHSCCCASPTTPNIDVTVRRYTGGLGHQWLHNPPGLPPGTNAGFYGAGAFFTPGSFLNENGVSDNEPGRPSPDDPNHYYEWNVKKVDTGIIEAGNAQGHCCKCATESDIDSCLLTFISNTNTQRPNFNIIWRNCRIMSERALSSCCLRKGSLIHSPSNSPSPGPGMTSNDATGLGHEGGQSTDGSTGSGGSTGAPSVGSTGSTFGPSTGPFGR